MKAKAQGRQCWASESRLRNLKPGRGLSGLRIPKHPARSSGASTPNAPAPPLRVKIELFTKECFEFRLVSPGLTLP